MDDVAIGPYPLNSIITGDARSLAKVIPDESIDLIFTDPIYDRTDDYRWLAGIAARVLKPDGVLLVWSSGRWQYQNTRWLDRESLIYRWTFTVIISDQSAPMNGKIIAKTNRVIWFDRGGARNMRTYLPDGYLSVGGLWGAIPAGEHHWGKSALYSQRCIECFTDPGDIVLDTFTGGGTIPAVCRSLRRRYLGFEIDPVTADLARQRVANTQPPLFTLQAEQTEMELS